MLNSRCFLTCSAFASVSIIYCVNTFIVEAEWFTRLFNHGVIAFLLHYFIRSCTICVRNTIEIILLTNLAAHLHVQCHLNLCMPAIAQLKLYIFTSVCCYEKKSFIWVEPDDSKNKEKTTNDVLICKRVNNFAVHTTHLYRYTVSVMS